MNDGARLPFPRGSTATSMGTTLVGNVVGGAQQSLLPSATGTFQGATPFRPDLAGIVVDARDFQLSNVARAAALGTTSFTAGSILTPGTNRPIKLRCVQAAADITVTYVGQLVQFSTTALEYGVVTAATFNGTTAGVVCKAIDNAIPIGTVIKAYDWFYVHEEGPCYLTVANGQTTAAQATVEYYTAGMCGPGAAGGMVVGTAHTAVTGSSSTYWSSTVVVDCKAGVQGSEP